MLTKVQKPSARRAPRYMADEEVPNYCLHLLHVDYGFLLSETRQIIGRLTTDHRFPAVLARKLVDSEDSIGTLATTFPDSHPTLAGTLFRFGRGLGLSARFRSPLRAHGVPRQVLPLPFTTHQRY